jgi:arylsulfatase A-like enzyme
LLPKPNILFIIGDDIGWMQVGVYHRSLALGATPNIDRIGQEGAVFTHHERPPSGLLRTVIEQPISGEEKG